MTVQVADLPAWVAVTVQDLSDVVVLLPAVSVVPDRLNPPTPFHVHTRVRAASAVMPDVPPVFATVSGLADTVTLQSLQDAYCFAPASCVMVRLLSDVMPL